VTIYRLMRPPYQVLTKDKPGSIHKGYFWAGHSPPGKIVFFLYDKSRVADVPKKFLSGFKGAVQCDAYAGFNFLDKPDWAKKVTKLGCIAYCWRYFEKSLDNEPENAKEIMLAIQKLYQIERIARNHKLRRDQIKELRQRFSVRILNAIEKRLKEHLPEILPKSNWGKAVQYTLRNWVELCRYTENGQWKIDNNLIEGTIRPIAIGRRNFLFAGSHEAAERSAMIYTFMATCKINNVNPYHWLKWVMVTLPDTKMSKIENLFPANFAKSHPEIEPVKP
jgi:transposase